MNICLQLVTQLLTNVTFVLYSLIQHLSTPEFFQKKSVPYLRPVQPDKDIAHLIYNLLQGRTVHALALGAADEPHDQNYHSNYRQHRNHQA